MGSSILHISDLLLWCIMAASTAYILLFALASLFRKKPPYNQKSLFRRHILPAPVAPEQYRFLVVFPAYQEDEVILPAVKAFLLQDYPAALFTVTVISDHMHDATNNQLAHLPIHLLTPSFETSSKAKALQYALANNSTQYDHVVILDADNRVAPNFLTRLNDICNRKYGAIQCHRCAKKSDNGVAVLDSLSEEINNTLFRRAHNEIGLSAALIGSGMCFPYGWFSTHVGKLSTAGEDKELEAMLTQEDIYIHYEEAILVRDEKVSNADNFQNQRLRWMTAQVQCFIAMLPYLPTAIRHRNMNYIDKTLQQALIPRSMLLLSLFLMSFISLAISPACSIKWWALFVVLCFSLLVAIPKKMRKAALLQKVVLLPQLVWRMLLNVRKINRHNKEFIHTEHKNQE